MRNKQKAWRAEAAKVKAAVVAQGNHIRGARYGRAVKRMRATMVVAKASTLSPLMNLMLVRYESLQP